jgi:hypothetical protein
MLSNSIEIPCRNILTMTCYIKPKGTCDTRNEFTRKYVQERLVYKKVRNFRLSHQKRDRGDNTVGWHDTEQYTTSMHDFWHFLPLRKQVMCARSMGAHVRGGTCRTKGIKNGMRNWIPAQPRNGQRN